MYLKKVRLENFARFHGVLERDFSSGINVVKGPLNEIGKSTFLAGIVTALFENPKSTKRELEKYVTWGLNRRPKTAIEFEAGDRKYLLEKDFELKTALLAGVDTGEEWNTPREVAEKLKELLGTDSSRLFLSTCCVRQDEVSDISSGKNEISDSLEGIVTGGTDETVASRVVKKLDKHISGLTKGLERWAKSPGPIARLAQQVDNLQQELTQVKEAVAEVEHQKVELIDVSNELDEVKVKLDEAETLLQKNKQRQEIEGKIGKLEKAYDNIAALIQSIESLQKKIQESESALQSIEGFDNMERVAECESQLRDLAAEHKNISDDLPKRRHELEVAMEHLKKNRLLEGLSSKTGLIIGVAVSVTGFLGMVFNTAALAVGVIGLLFLIAAMWARSALARQKIQISDLQERIERMEDSLKQVAEQERMILSQIHCDSAEEFRQKERTYASLTERKNAFQNQLQGKLGMQTLEQIERQRRESARMLAEEREKLTDDLKSTSLSPEEYVKLEKQVERFRNRKDELERRKMELEMSIGKAKYDVEDEAQKEETLDALLNALKREQRRLKVYELARDFVSRARAETLLSAADLLQAEIQKNFEIFTRGKYSSVKIGEESMDFWVYSDEKGDWVRPEELSGGTIDEFYLACRIALVRLIYGEIKPPLALDDPFVNFDEPRLIKTLEFLSKLSKEHQIIIFTLRGTYDGIADQIIELT